MKNFRLFFYTMLIPFLAACTQIDTGNVAVMSTLGQVDPKPGGPGIYWTIFKRVDEVNGREIRAAFADLHPKSKENLTMADFDVDVYYRIDASKAAELMTKFSGDLTKGEGSVLVAHNYFMRQARAAIFNAAQRFPASEMNNRRAEVEEAIRTGLQAALDTDVGKNWFTIGNVNASSIVPDKAMEASIQAAAATTFEIERKTKQIELAKREGERLAIEAEGIARYNKILGESLTPNLIRLKEIEAQKSFATAGTHTVIMGSSAAPVLQVGK